MRFCCHFAGQLDAQVALWLQLAELRIQIDIYTYIYIYVICYTMLNVYVSIRALSHAMC